MATTFGPPKVDEVIVRPDVTRLFRRSALLCVLLTVLFVAWVSLGIGGTRLSNSVDDLGELVAALVAAVVCVVASRRVRGARVGWLLMAASSFSWACGEAMWCYYDLVRGVALPSPSAADLGFLAAVPLAVAGLRNLFPQPPRAGISRFGGFVLGMFLGSVALVVVWSLTLVGDADRNALLQQVVSLAYPVGDLVMAAVVLSAVRHGTGERTTMRLVLAGIVAFAVADTWFAIVVSIGDFGQGAWLNTGWVLGYFLVALGAVWALDHPAPAAAQAALFTRRMVAATNTPRGAPATARAASRSSTGGSGGGGQYWLATANAEHIVNYAAIVLIVADASVVLYDLAAVLKILA